MKRTDSLNHDFEQAFDRLRQAWVDHQEMRGRGVEIRALAGSSQQLFDARLEMGRWRAANHRYC